MVNILYSQNQESALTEQNASSKLLLLSCIRSLYLAEQDDTRCKNILSSKAQEITFCTEPSYNLSYTIYISVYLS